MRTMLKIATSDDAWIGLHTVWQWSQADRGFLSEEESLYRNWEKGQPDNNNGNENCAAMRKGGRFHDFRCDLLCSFICYDESSTETYILITEKKTWTEAQSYCRQNHTDLVSVRNQTENEKVKVEVTNQADYYYWWIGLYKNWKGSDESKSSYRNWEKTSDHSSLVGDNRICAVVSSGQWKKKKCNEEYRFICYEDNLILVKQSNTWAEALTYCRQHHHHLVTVSTETLQHWVKRRAENASTSHVWLGLRFCCTLRFWFWVSLERLCYENWGVLYLGSECGHAGAVESRNGQKWFSLPETERLNFICRK
ncbi:hypothetical protein SKAU_G00378160 [Synaphobranchus kaupii]|uniref:C-type lectin domain-containing protein n=1 Tax=Synaphobranchus kaupii TaxID=118154 RepID=A0A9Q1ED52_SYNKA|nr:hypothetical protein SKAU_G00378160 [Synaphobranchus kaupii]